MLDGRLVSFGRATCSEAGVPLTWNFLEKRACKTNPVVSFNLVNTVNFNAAPTLPSVCPYLVKSVAYRFTVDLFVCLVNIEDLLFKKCLRMRLSVDLLQLTSFIFRLIILLGVSLSSGLRVSLSTEAPVGLTEAGGVPVAIYCNPVRSVSRRTMHESLNISQALNEEDLEQLIEENLEHLCPSDVILTRQSDLESCLVKLLKANNKIFEANIRRTL